MTNLVEHQALATIHVVGPAVQVEDTVVPLQNTVTSLLVVKMHLVNVEVPNLLQCQLKL